MDCPAKGADLNQIEKVQVYLKNELNQIDIHLKEDQLY